MIENVELIIILGVIIGTIVGIFDLLFRIIRYLLNTNKDIKKEITNAKKERIDADNKFNEQYGILCRGKCYNCDQKKQEKQLGLPKTLAEYNDPKSKIDYTHCPECKISWEKHLDKWKKERKERYKNMTDEERETIRFIKKKIETTLKHFRKEMITTHDKVKSNGHGNDLNSLITEFENLKVIFEYYFTKLERLYL